MQKMGYNKTNRTMDCHVASVRSTGYALSPVKKDCRHSSLKIDQMSKVHDWILAQNTKNSPIGYSDVQKSFNDKFTISVCRRTAGNILRRLEHTRRSVKAQWWFFQNKRPIEDTA